jgi:hypothetical protein
MRRAKILCGVFSLIVGLGVVAVCKGGWGTLQYSQYPGPASPPILPPQAGVPEILARLESLKARREAIDQEEQAMLAALREQLKLPAPPVMPGPPPTIPFTPPQLTPCRTGQPIYPPGTPSSAPSPAVKEE